MKEPMVADLASRENQGITGFFAAGSKQARTKKDGTRYFAMTLCDRTGAIEARVWDADDAGDFEPGDVVKVRGQVCRYNEKLQVNVDKIRRASANEYELSDFLPQSERNAEEMWAELQAWVASFTDADFKALLEAFLTDAEIAAALRQAPAARGLHHAWIGGLLEHVVDLIGFCDLAASHFPLIHRDLLLTGAILHDIGKIYELSWERGFEYTLEGQLIGHISIATRLLDEKVKSLPGFPRQLHTLVEHIILSHHGSLEFGSPKLPMIPEAVLLHYLDDAEAKMLAIQEACLPTAEGAPDPVFIDRVRALERPVVNTRAFLAQAGPKET